MSEVLNETTGDTVTQANVSEQDAVNRYDLSEEVEEEGGVEYFSFETAIHLLKKGYIVTRRGWDIRSFTPESNWTPEMAKTNLGSFIMVCGPESVKTIFSIPNPSPSPEYKITILKSHADGTVSIGWCPDNDDLFVKDWCIVPLSEEEAGVEKPAANEETDAGAQAA